MDTPEELLPGLEQTRRFAVRNIPWYRDREEYQQPLGQLSDLGRWPLIKPEVFRDSPWVFASNLEWPAGITFSSSTTGNTGRPRWHSHAEGVAYDEFVRRARPRTGKGFTLNIHAFDQGAALASPGESGTQFVPLLNPWHYELILSLLRDGWRNRAGTHRVELIHAFSPGLRVLTNWLQERDIDPSDFGVCMLTGYGSIQPESWRRRLEREWSAKYVDQFGLSEVKMSAAIQCQVCGNYHFHRPIFAEVVNPENGDPCKEGAGILVLSELYPLAQAQVLLRYWTGDLVELAEPCMLSTFGFRPLGRAQYSVYGPPYGSGPVVGSLQVGEICAEFPDVATTPLAWASWATDAGPPRFSLRGTDQGAELVVELRFDPALHPGRAEQTCQFLQQRLENEITGLLAASREGRFKLHVTAVRPGVLSETTRV